MIAAPSNPGTTMIRSLFAEALGCALLALAALGGAHAAAAAGLPAIPVIAVAAGLMLAVTITIMIPVSGGHLNPAITLLFWHRREIGAARALAYVTAQALGALGGGTLVALMYGSGAAHLTVGAGWGLSEALAAGGFVLIVAGALAARPAAVPALAGAFGAVAVLTTASGGMANPAVMLARALTAGPGSLAPLDALILACWQIGGAALVLIPARWLFTPDRRT